MYLHERDEQREQAPRAPATMPTPEFLVEGLVRAYFAERGLSYALARYNAWYPARLAGVPRVVIPATASDPRWVYWQARAVVPNEKRYDSPHTDRLDAVVVVYPLGSLARRRYVVCEGPMDALAAAGLDWTGIALMGTNLKWEWTDPTWDRIARMIGDCDCVVLADRDAEGIAAAGRWTTYLLRRGVAPRVRMAPVPYKDLAETPPERRQEALT